MKDNLMNYEWGELDLAVDNIRYDKFCHRLVFLSFFIDINKYFLTQEGLFGQVMDNAESENAGRELIYSMIDTHSSVVNSVIESGSTVSFDPDGYITIDGGLVSKVPDLEKIYTEKASFVQLLTDLISSYNKHKFSFRVGSLFKEGIYSQKDIPCKNYRQFFKLIKELKSDIKDLSLIKDGNDEFYAFRINPVRNYIRILYITVAAHLSAYFK